MNYVKQFDILGVDSRQTSCIELNGKPTTATVGAFGVLGIDVTSPNHDMYKCVAVNGAIYTWKPVVSVPSSTNGKNGLNVFGAVESRSGLSTVSFPLTQLNIPSGYAVKVGDLIIDPDGYLYQVTSTTASSCRAEYFGTRFIYTPVVGEDYWTEEEKTGIVEEAANMARAEMIVEGSYKGTGSGTAVELTFDFAPKLFVLFGATSWGYLSVIATPAGNFSCWTRSGQEFGDIENISIVGNKVTLTNNSLFNYSGKTYSYVAIG